MGGLLSHTTGSSEISETSCSQNQVRFWGHITRDLYEVFRKYDDGKDRIPIGQLRKAFNDVHLFPSRSQIFEMVQCAVEYGSPCEPDHVTFGEFCILVNELNSHYQNCQGITSPKPKSLYKEKRQETDSIKWKKREISTHFQVFLGGSCNPTTWRHDIAIPFFKEHGITFYNPQVQNWRPELVELEAQAKESADILFFVIVKETRAISSLIEVGYLVASQKQVIVVLTERCNKTKCDFTTQEMEDLCRGKRILEDLVERNSVPVFTDIHVALKCTEICLTQGLRVQDLTLQHGAQPVLHGHIPVGETLLQMREAFNSMNSAGTAIDEQKLTPQELKLAYKSCTGKDLEHKCLKKKDKNGHYCFEEFCGIMVESQVQHTGIHRKIAGLLTAIISRLTGHDDSMSISYSEKEYRDVYLGGSCGDSNWRDKTAIPLLRKNGISYINPHITGYNQRLIPIQVAAREKCRILLYVITNRTRSLSSMIEAGYYVGLGCKVVLCIQQITEGAVISGEKITKCGWKDYTRGRAYLTDLANREGVHIFENVEEAVSYCVRYLQEQTVETVHKQVHTS